MRGEIIAAFARDVVRAIIRRNDVDDGVERALASDGWTIVVIYRGAWCPFCRRQLADFAEHAPALEAAGISVVGVSVDDLANTRRMRDEIAFPFPLAYGLDPIATASAIGGFYEADPAGAYLHPAAFIMGPDGRLHGTTYRSSAVGRLAAEEALALIAFEKNRDKAGA